MKPSRHLFTLIFPLATALTCHPLAAQAQTVAPVPAPTIITSAPYTITTAGYYQLGANLSYAGNGATNDAIITINAPNVTLDFGGHFISGPTGNAATTVDGIYAYEKGNLTIKNGTISHCYFSINLSGNETSTSANVNQHIDNMLMINAYYYGAFFRGASDSTVSNCHVANITGSTVINGAVGVYFSDGTGNQIVNTTVNTVTGTGAGGYGLAGTNNVLVTNCVVSNVTDTVATGEAYGIYYPSVATGNTITNCNIGINYSTKYKDNVTVNCNTPFSGGTAVGTNN